MIDKVRGRVIADGANWLGYTGEHFVEYWGHRVHFTRPDGTTGEWAGSEKEFTRLWEPVPPPVDALQGLSAEQILRLVLDTVGTPYYCPGCGDVWTSDGKCCDCDTESKPVTPLSFLLTQVLAEYKLKGTAR